MEVSPNPGGLPFRFIIKFAITTGVFLLLLQAIALLLDSILTILNKKSAEPNADVENVDNPSQAGI